MRLTDEQKTENLFSCVLEINRLCFPSVRASDEKMAKMFRTGDTFIIRTGLGDITGFAVCEQFIYETPRLVIVPFHADVKTQSLRRQLLMRVPENVPVPLMRLRPHAHSVMADSQSVLIEVELVNILTPSKRRL